MLTTAEYDDGPAGVSVSYADTGLCSSAVHSGPSSRQKHPCIHFRSENRVYYLTVGINIQSRRAARIPAHLSLPSTRYIFVKQWGRIFSLICFPNPW